MLLNTRLSDDCTQLTIITPVRLVFDFYRDLREAYEKRPSEVRNIVIDFARTEYIDSSAIGMLLLLNRYAIRQQLSVELINCSSQVFNALHVMRMGKLFDIATMTDRDLKK